MDSNSYLSKDKKVESEDAGYMTIPEKQGESRIFVFNGDADGIISQHILGLHAGAPDLLITGWKRDIRLLRKLPDGAAGDIHVFDISLRQNLEELPGLLAREGARVTWYDHHDPGDPPSHARLKLHISQAPGTCTAAIVNAVCGGVYPGWAAMAAYGDNVPVTGDALLREAGIDGEDRSLLRKGGILINYNAYGEKPGDALLRPDDVAGRMAGFASALDFCRDAGLLYSLEEQFARDGERFGGLKSLVDSEKAAAFLLPDEPWARRYGATWANERILARPGEALAILLPRDDGSYMVSIRSALKIGKIGAASDLAGEFPTGGGRRLAAGINRLSAEDLLRFLDRFLEFYGK